MAHSRSSLISSSYLLAATVAAGLRRPGLAGHSEDERAAPMGTVHPRACVGRRASEFGYVPLEESTLWFCNNQRKGPLHRPPGLARMAEAAE